MIDAYDVLGLDFEAEGEEIKKAYRRLSLLHHPDKVQTGQGCVDEANERFNEIKVARDTLLDPERRKVHDTFGMDLGEERPEMEVWNIGMQSMLSPVGHFALKTVVMRLAIWIAGVWFIGWMILLAGVIAGLLWAMKAEIKGISARSKDVEPILGGVAIAVVVVVVTWVWQQLADTVGVMYLVSETILDVAMLVETWKMIAAVIGASFFFAWLVRGWWFWIIGLLVGFAAVAFIAIIMASELTRLWIDSVKSQHGQRLKSWRIRLRHNRKKLQDEVADLKKRVQELESTFGR